MAAQHSPGISTLLEAEKDGARIVQQAREYRAKRLRDARQEAQKEIQEYHTKKEAELLAFEASRAGSTSTAQSEVEQQTERLISAIEAAYAAHKDAVIKKLLARVMLVDPELHRNFKPLKPLKP